MFLLISQFSQTTKSITENGLIWSRLAKMRPWRIVWIIQKSVVLNITAIHQNFRFEKGNGISHSNASAQLPATIATKQDSLSLVRESIPVADFGFATTQIRPSVDKAANFSTCRLKHCHLALEVATIRRSRNSTCRLCRLHKASRTKIGSLRVHFWNSQRIVNKRVRGKLAMNGTLPKIFLIDSRYLIDSHDGCLKWGGARGTMRCRQRREIASQEGNQLRGRVVTTLLIFGKMCDFDDDSLFQVMNYSRNGRKQCKEMRPCQARVLIIVLVESHNRPIDDSRKKSASSKRISSCGWSKWFRSLSSLRSDLAYSNFKHIYTHSLRSEGSLERLAAAPGNTYSFQSKRERKKFQKD